MTKKIKIGRLKNGYGPHVVIRVIKVFLEGLTFELKLNYQRGKKMVVSTARVKELEMRGFGICLASTNTVLEDSDASVRIILIVRILAQATL